MNDIAAELVKLHKMTGAEFSRQVERIARQGEFHFFDGETSIFVVGGERQDDFENLIAAAHKAVEHGFRVFILPNPKGFRTADFIFERKGKYRMYDLKTIHGKSSVINRLKESIGQCDHVLLNMTVDYNARKLAKEIVNYFAINPNGVEVMIFKRGKLMSVTRSSVKGKDFIKSFIVSYMR